MESAEFRLESPLRMLRKTLKKTAKDPTPKRIHNLRTLIRHTVAVVHVALDDTSPGDRLLRSVKPVYKKAGKVRDMDVLTVFAAGLQVEGEDGCKTRLLEFLVARRKRAAKKLQRTLGRKSAQLGRRLRRCARWIENGYAAPQDKIRNSGGNSHDTNPLVLRLAARLASSPKLNRENLHPYRAQVKELRYLLSLAGDRDAEFSDRLHDVKDSIGAWHDWSELAAISSKVLNHDSQCRLQKHIETIAAEQFDEALAQANSLQRQAFHRDGGGIRAA